MSLLLKSFISISTSLYSTIIVISTKKVIYLKSIKLL